MLGCDHQTVGPAGVSPGAPLRPGTAIGGPGDGPGRFVKPRAIASDGEHAVVVDRSGRVQVLDDTGRCVAWWRLEKTVSGFPTGVAIGPAPGTGQLAIWLADTHNHRVLVYAWPPLTTQGPTVPESTPALLLTFGTYGEGPGQMVYPCGVALHNGDSGALARVFVSEFGGHDRISIYDVQGADLRFVRSFGREGPAEPGATDITFQRPQSMLVWKDPRAGAQKLVVTDSVNHRLGVFSLEGVLERWIEEPGQFLHPRGLTDLGDGTALVVEFGRNRVQHLDLTTGKALNAWGRAGRGPGELAEPWTAALVRDEVWIVDALNHRLVRMQRP
jgi:hypothetical protein